MASQRVLLFTMGGALAATIWEDVCRWSDAREKVVVDQCSPDHWPADTRAAVDAFVDALTKSSFVPPILYRSEHIDCWSMGDVFELALAKGHRDASRRLFTAKHEVIATWVRYSEQLNTDPDAPAETRWLYARINEAIGAWGDLAENRLVVMVRSGLGKSWTDEEVKNALGSVPSWWTETEQRRASNRVNG